MLHSDIDSDVTIHVCGQEVLCFQRDLMTALNLLVETRRDALSREIQPFCTLITLQWLRHLMPPPGNFMLVHGLRFALP